MHKTYSIIDNKSNYGRHYVAVPDLGILVTIVLSNLQTLSQFIILLTRVLFILLLRESRYIYTNIRTKR